MEKENATVPFLKFQKYVLTRRGASSSPEPPGSPGVGPSSPDTPRPPDLSLHLLRTPWDDLSLHRKLVRPEREVNALTELIPCLMT